MLYPFPKYLLMILSNTRHGAGQHFAWTKRPFLWFTVRSRVWKQTFTTFPLAGLNCFKCTSNIVKGAISEVTVSVSARIYCPFLLLLLLYQLKSGRDWILFTKSGIHPPFHSTTLQHSSLISTSFILFWLSSVTEKEFVQLYSTQSPVKQHREGRQSPPGEGHTFHNMITTLSLLDTIEK